MPLNSYHYGAYFETLLDYDDGAKALQLARALWCKDTTDLLHNVKTAGADCENAGLVKCASFATKSKMFEMMGRPPTEIFFEEKKL